MEEKNNDLTQIIAQILNEIKQELGSDFDFEKINLAELERRSGISRAKLRRLKANGFVDAPHGQSERTQGRKNAFNLNFQRNSD